jgi:hypothetical protein
MKENGYNWMNACGMYVFAGFFAIHGWRCPGWLTWVSWCIIFRYEWYLSNHDIAAEVDPRIAWAFETFRMRSPIRPRGRFILRGGDVILTCPLTYLWGVVALYGFRIMEFPLGMSKILAFSSGKAFLIHFFDMFPLTNSALPRWTRRKEASHLPWIHFKSQLLTTVQIGNLALFLDIFRERLFTRMFQLVQGGMIFLHKCMAIRSINKLYSPALSWARL